MLSALIITCPAPQKAHLGITGSLVWIQPSQLVSSSFHSKAAQLSKVGGDVEMCRAVRMLASWQQAPLKIQEFVTGQVSAQAVSLPWSHS